MPTLRIVILCTLAAIFYGVVHDQITARICVEYFTVGHPKIIESESPTVLGLVWGVVATWWVGVPLGVLVALAARIGRWPQRNARQLIPSLAVLLVVMGVCATLWGSLAPGSYVPYSISSLSSRIAEEKYVPYLTCRSAHEASYQVGIMGGFAVAAVTVLQRWRDRRKRLEI